MLVWGMSISKMPFGKHKGQSLKSIPSDYLLWLLKNIDLKEPLKSSVIETLDTVHNIVVTKDDFFDTVSDNSVPPWEEKDEPPWSVKLAKELVEAGFKALCKKYHPDKGGTHEDFIKLQSIRDILMEEVE